MTPDDVVSPATPPLVDDGAGAAEMPPAATGRDAVVLGSSRADAGEDHLRRLSVFEAQVLIELARGGTVPEIAVALGTSEAVIGQHLQAVQQKLRVATPEEAFGHARRHGWIPESSDAV